MTKSRLWHPSDPKHVVIISPWLPVGVDVIRTHIPTGKTVTQAVAWNQSATGLGGLEWSNKNYERIQFELLCSPFYSVLTALISVDKNLSCVRHALLLFFFNYNQICCNKQSWSYDPTALRSADLLLESTTTLREETNSCVLAIRSLLIPVAVLSFQNCSCPSLTASIAAFLSQATNWDFMRIKVLGRKYFLSWNVASTFEAFVNRVCLEEVASNWLLSHYLLQLCRNYPQNCFWGQMLWYTSVEPRVHLLSEGRCVYIVHQTGFTHPYSWPWLFMNSLHKTAELFIGQLTKAKLSTYVEEMRKKKKIQEYNPQHAV